MCSDNLLEAITAGSTCASEDSRRIGRWVSRNPAFRQFIRTYQAKITKKLRTAKTRDDELDVLAELDVARLLVMDSENQVEYEPRFQGQTRSPDFLVTPRKHPRFTIEVKRVSRTKVERQLDEFIGFLISGVKAIHSSLGLSFSIIVGEETGSSVHAIWESRESILERIRDTLAECEATLQDGGERSWRGSIFSDLRFSCSRIAGKPHDGPTAIICPVWEIPFLQNEWKKISDSIREKVGQFPPGLVNVMLFRLDSDTHSPADLTDAINELNGRIQERDDEFFRWKGINSAEEFLMMTRRLSGIVFRTSWAPSPELQNENEIWVNQYAACLLTNGLVEYLRRMDDGSHNFGC
jgi:hypothetical protein